MCLRREVEGIYIPLGNSLTEGDYRLFGVATRLMDYFLGPPWNGSGAISGLTPEDADAIDRVRVSGLAGRLSNRPRSAARLRHPDLARL
jgi:hypothetical protein